MMERKRGTFNKQLSAQRVPRAKGWDVGAMQVGLKEVGPDLVPLDEEATGGRCAGM